MALYSRRRFLKQIGAAAAFVFTSQSVLSFPRFWFVGGIEDFEMLVIGDSLVGGQGLKEEYKFYTLTKNWLETEFFKGNRKVSLKIKAHSGSKIYLGDDEIKAMGEAEKDLDEFYHPEINFSFPSMNTQIDVAKKEYGDEGIRVEDVKLIMLSGGITNLDTSYLINPFKKNKPLRRKITKYCNEEMFRLLQYTAKTFPDALIMVIGYYPMVSKKSSSGAIYNTLLEFYEFPGLTKPLMNNILTKQFFKILHTKMNKRSRIWAEGSNREFQNAVNRLNTKYGSQKAVFVKSPITGETTFETKNTLLWRMGKKGRSEDQLYDVRQIECPKAIEQVKDVKLEFKQRFCELSGLGHPNIDGSRVYAEAIERLLQTILQKQNILSK